MPHKNIIVYYHLSGLAFSSFYLSGFLQNRKKFNYQFVVSHSTPPILHDSSMGGEWGKLLPSICIFKARIDTEAYYFCIDARDSATTTAGMGYHLPLLEKVKYYFKVNYNAEAIHNDSALQIFGDKIIPTAPFFPVKIPLHTLLLPGSLSGKNTHWKLRKALSTLKQQLKLVPLKRIRKLRRVKQDLDVLFVTKYYGKHTETDEMRYEIVNALKNHRKIKSISGIIGGSELPAVDRYDRVRIDAISQKDFLAYLSRAKLGIYVRGPHDCISFKFGELMALGKPIIGQKILNNKDFYYNNKYFDEQFAYETPHEIVQRVVDLLNQPNKLSRLGKSNAHIFDIKLAPEHAVADIIDIQLKNRDMVRRRNGEQ